MHPRVKENRIDKTIKLSEYWYIKTLLLENTTILFIHLIDVQKISKKCPPRFLDREKINSKLRLQYFWIPKYFVA